MIKKNLPRNLLRFLKGESSSDGIKNAITRSFFTTNHEIFASDFDSNLSGSTLISVLLKNNKIYCANVGDSRAIICRSENGNHKAIPLSID